MKNSAGRGRCYPRRPSTETEKKTEKKVASRFAFIFRNKAKFYWDDYSTCVVFAKTVSMKVVDIYLHYCSLFLALPICWFCLC